MQIYSELHRQPSGVNIGHKRRVHSVQERVGSVKNKAGKKFRVNPKNLVCSPTKSNLRVGFAGKNPPKVIVRCIRNKNHPK
jgi:hypothetical protein